MGAPPVGMDRDEIARSVSDLTFVDLFPGSTVVGVPPAVAATEPLYPEEASSVAGAVEKRRLEFTLGRACGRAALLHLGASAGPIAVSPERAPVWPEDVVGSITHRSRIVAAAVAWQSQFAGIGLDVEAAGQLSPSVTRRVCTAAELDWISSHPAPAGACWGTVIFSAKEALYKAVFPLTMRWLGFSDVEIHLEPDRRRFVPRFVGESAGRLSSLGELSGTFAIRDGLVIAALTLRRMGPRPA
jgi:4'-phosphopantetheinyl transferase EntD